MFVHRTIQVAALALIACTPVEPTGPTDEDVATWAGSDSWQTEAFARTEHRTAWVRACIAEVPASCLQMCDLRAVQAPIRPESVPNSYRLTGHELVRGEIDSTRSTTVDCQQYAPIWNSNWQGQWMGSLAMTWTVTSDARTATELSAERGMPKRRDMPGLSNSVPRGTTTP